MTFEETRDNTTAIENLIIEGDAREDIDSEDADSDGPPLRRVVFIGFGGDPDDPEHDEVGDADTNHEIPVLRDDEDEYEEPEEDDGQPTEYEEWQDFYGGDDWDQGQHDDGDHSFGEWS
jgi:hypothetical protein